MKILNGILNEIPNPNEGLPEDVFEAVSALTPMVNVDLVIRDKTGGILMSWRDDDQCGTGWHIPGGIIRFQETRLERLRKTALKEIGCEVIWDSEPFMIFEAFLPQKVRGHFISFAYNCKLAEGYELPSAMLWREDLSRTEAVGKLCWHNHSPELWVRGQKEFYEHLFEQREETVK